MCHANIVKFRDAISSIDWREILSRSDAQVAYSSFHRILSEKYNNWFPIRKSVNDILTISLGLKLP